MRKALLSALIAGYLFTGCENSSSSIENVSFDSSVAKNGSPQDPASNNNITSPATLQQPAMQTIPASSQPVTAAPAPTAPGMNPPHGQPGHRCDIAVGAPLNSPPAKITTPVTTTIQANPPASEKAVPLTQPVSKDSSKQ